MRAIILGASALVLSAGVAVAAEDLKPAPAYQWAGLYAGVHLGLAHANRNGCGDIGVEIPILDWQLWTPNPIDSCDGAPPEMAFDYNQSGHLAGIQGGYNWALSDNFLVGVEVAASAANLRGDLDGVFGGVGGWNGVLTATAKAGLAQGRWMVYGEAGFGSAHASYEGDLGCNFTSKHSGPVAGAGISYMITDRTSIDLKYQHLWLGPQQSWCVSTPFEILEEWFVIPTETRAQGHMDIFKIGLNFQLGN